jgi:hypothetical protein
MDVLTVVILLSPQHNTQLSCFQHLHELKLQSTIIEFANSAMYERSHTSQETQQKAMNGLYP